MKRFFLYTMMFYFTLYNSAMSEESSIAPELLDQIEERTLQPFFNALKNGNVEVIKRYITGDMYMESRVMLEEDGNYPDFLRNHYKGAVFTVEHGVLADKQIIVSVETELPGIGKRSSRFFLVEEELGQESLSLETQATAGERLWRITEQRLDPAN